MAGATRTTQTTNSAPVATSTPVGTLATASAVGRFAWLKLIPRIAPPMKATQPRVPIAVATAASTVTRFAFAKQILCAISSS